MQNIACYAYFLKRKTNAVTCRKNIVLTPPFCSPQAKNMADLYHCLKATSIQLPKSVKASALTCNQGKPTLLCYDRR